MCQKRTKCMSGFFDRDNVKNIIDCRIIGRLIEITNMVFVDALNHSGLLKYNKSIN